MVKTRAIAFVNRFGEKRTGGNARLSWHPGGKYTLPVAGRDHIQGHVGAPVALLEYGDFECPVCGEVHSVVKVIQDRLGDELCFAYRHFPITSVHPHSAHAAEAADAARAQGRFWAMHDLLYENQDALEDEDLAQYAVALGLDARRPMTSHK